MGQKVSQPKTFQEYLEKTEHAVQHLYAGLASCWAVYEEASSHWDVSKIGSPHTPEYEAELSRYLEGAGRYFELKFSEGTFAGSILQVAYMAIYLFSSNKTVPPSCRQFVQTARETRLAAPFCIGKEVDGVPVGLIIYAARNQYSHWDEKPYPIDKRVFDTLSLAHIDDMHADLAYALSNPTITVYANEILLGLLEWTTYGRYLAEMQALSKYMG